MLNLPDQVSIIEVGPRDGLQNEKNIIPTEAKIAFIQQLKAAGITEMELTSFVSPKWVPQMQDADKIVAACIDQTRNFVLTPNRKGVERIYPLKCNAIAFFIGVSNTFNKKNINKTTNEALEEITPLILDVKKKNFFVRICISTSFYCPYEGKISPEKVLSLCSRFVDLGVDELSIADTIGMANPRQVYDLFSSLTRIFPTVLLTAHFHDTRKMALANIVAALQTGVTRFDTSAGGLGGCPFAKGATGNVATEDVVFMLEEMGVKTGLSLKQLVKALQTIEPYLSHPFDSGYFYLSKQ